MTTAGTLAATGRPSSGRLVIVVALLLAVSVGVQVIRDRGWQPYEPATPLMWLQSGPLVKRAALGFDNVLADLYWMRAVVYYGGQRRGASAVRNYDLLYPLLDLVTTLDPHFKIAYRFGAIFLTEAYPNGPGRPDQAIDLLQRAIASNATTWEYMEDIGFVYYWWLQDYKTAAAWFDRAGRQPGAPQWLVPLAATTLVRGGDRESSRTLWRSLLDSGEEGWFARNAALRLQQLDAMDALDAINAALGRFTAREGRMPRDWRELATTEHVRGAPVDPAGVPYVVDPTTHTATVARQSPLFPLPTDTPAFSAVQP